MSVAAYNLGTAVGSWIAGLTLGSALGATGPAVVGTVIALREPCLYAASFRCRRPGGRR